MKIAILGIKGLPSKGGAERVVEAIVDRLKNKHEISVYTRNLYTPKDTRLTGLNLVHIPCLPGKHFRALSYFIISAFHALLVGRYDIIHIHNAEACFVVPLLRLRYRVIATSHGPAHERKKWGAAAKILIQAMDYFFIKYPNILTSVSLPMVESYKIKWNQDVFYIPNGADNALPIDDKASDDLLSKMGIKEPYLLFSAGRIDSTKGCHTVIEAFKSLDIRLNLVIVGDTQVDPAYSARLKNAARSDSRIHFVPFVADKGTIFGIVVKAKIFIFPSEVEAMSMALLEAASLAIPIVCSDIPANTAVLRDEHALFFKTGSVHDLKEKLDWALDHQQEMRLKGLKAQKFVIKNNSWDSIARQYEELYKSLISARYE
jgi:glycosyltransferase involved in cell wall biosynthesis